MDPIPFKPKAYLREGRPFSFKFLLFASEAGIRPSTSKPSFRSFFDCMKASGPSPAVGSLSARPRAQLFGAKNMHQALGLMLPSTILHVPLAEAVFPGMYCIQPSHC